MAALQHKDILLNRMSCHKLITYRAKLGIIKWLLAGRTSAPWAAVCHFTYKTKFVGSKLCLILWVKSRSLAEMKGQGAQINRRNRSIGLFEVFPASNCILSSLNKGQWCFWRNLPFWKDPQSFQWISTKDALFTVVERAASFKLQASTKILASLCLFEILRLSAWAGQVMYVRVELHVEGKSALTSAMIELISRKTFSWM